MTPNHPRELTSDRSPRLVMISGPIASGKSSVAAELTSRLRDAGRSVVIVDLDTVAGMALPTLPNWEWAHRIHAQLVGLWLASEIDIVVDEGTSTPTEVDQVLEQIPEATGVLHVVVRVDFEQALARAQADATRGISRDREFLRRDHQRFAAIEHLLPCDLRLHAEEASASELADEILGHLTN